MKDLKILIIVCLVFSTLCSLAILNAKDNRIDALVQERNRAERLHQECDENSTKSSEEIDKWRSEAILCWRQQDEDCRMFEDEE